MNVILLVAGTFMDVTPAILIFKNIGHADKEHDHAAHLRAVHHDLPKRLYRNIPVNDPQRAGEEQQGYDKGLCSATNGASAPSGLLIPPSNALITYSLRITTREEIPMEYEMGTPSTSSTNNTNKIKNKD